MIVPKGVKTGLTFDDSPKNNSKEGGFIIDDISFYNTSLVTEAANHFRKYGCYEYPPPTPKNRDDLFYYERFKDSRVYDDYRKYWNRELHRIKNGIIIPGALQPDGSLQKIFITGRHYGYLNYSRMELTEEGINVSDATKGENSIQSVTGTTETDFPKFRAGDYYYFATVDKAEQLGHNIVVDKTRQVGYSYKNAWVIANEAYFYSDVKCLISAFSDAFLTKEGTMTKTKDNIDFMNIYTDWKKELKSGSGANQDMLEFGYKYLGEDSWRGINSSIQSRTFFHKTKGARAGKYRKILLEEGGAFPNVLDVIKALNAGTRSGKVVIGMWILFGTGSAVDATDWKGFQEVFYNPRLYECLPFVNIWDDNLSHSTCGFFHPRTLDLEPFIDKDGNTDKVKALEAVKEQRASIEKDDISGTTLPGHTAEFPIKPSESFFKAQNNLFVTQGLIDHANRVNNDQDYNFGRHGILELDSNGKLRFITNGELEASLRHPPILKYKIEPHKEDINGCVTIYFEPYRDERGRIPDNMYYTIVDSYGVDTDLRTMTSLHSLGAAYVYEALNNFTSSKGDRLVAKLVGRPEKVETFNKNTFLLHEYYGGGRQYLFENDGAQGTVVLRDAKALNKTKLLMMEPEFEYNDALKGKTGRVYGVCVGARKERISYALNGLKEWLHAERGQDENGSKLYNYHLIYDSRLLDEFLQFGVGNFDCISALRLLTFLRDERLHKNVHVESKRRTVANSFFNPEYVNG